MHIDPNDPRYHAFIKFLEATRKSQAERFTDAVLAAWLTGMIVVLTVTAYWLLRGGQLP